MPDKPIFPTPADAEAAFYDAIERADLEALMSVWAEDDEIVCIHPGGPRLIGYAAVRETWRRIFESGPRLRVRLSQATVVQNPFATIQTVIEHISVRDDESLRAPVHSSPAPPDSGTELPRKTLH